MGAKRILSEADVSNISASELNTAISNAMMTSFFQNTINIAINGGMMETQSINYSLKSFLYYYEYMEVFVIRMTLNHKPIVNSFTEDYHMFLI
ncbi:hypothetical protein GCM10027170_31150 [Aliiglaciecola aliphaticivorans]